MDAATNTYELATDGDGYTPYEELPPPNRGLVAAESLAIVSVDLLAKAIGLAAAVVALAAVAVIAAARWAWEYRPRPRPREMDRWSGRREWDCFSEARRAGGERGGTTINQHAHTIINNFYN